MKIALFRESGFMGEQTAPESPARLVLDPAVAVVCLLALALTVGGGGVREALGNLAVQLLALGILALHARSVGGFLRWGPRIVAVLVAATCLVPLIQLVPLPPGMWSGLPGRELVAQSMDLTGGRGWFPLSVDPARTLVAFLGLIAPLTIIVVGCGLPPDRLVLVQRAAIAIGLLVALFGASHLLNDHWGDLYSARRPLPGVLVATFADRNAAALFLVACLLLLIGLPAPPRGLAGMALRVVAGGFLAMCVVLTGSRTGMVLLAAPALLLIWRLGAMIASRRGDQARTAVRVGAGVLVLALVAAAVVLSGRGQASLSRFDDADGMRAEMREDARFAAGRYWPVGAGMGTFDEVFQIDESLEYVSPRRAGRAHMDYLELAVEAGLAGLLLAAAWLGWAAWRGWRAAMRPGAWPARAGALIVAGIAAQSVLSFPLRSQAMLCVAALAVVLLARGPVAVAAPAEKEP